MAISENKERRQISLDRELWEYLDNRLAQERPKRFGNTTVSTLISELVKSDQKIREVFREE